MPTKTLLICVLGGIAIVAVLIATGVGVSKGSRLTLEGSIQKVRVGKLDDQRSVVVVDGRFTNPSRYPFQIQGVELDLTLGSEQKTGRFIPETDARRVFEAVPELGDKYNPSFSIRERIPVQATEDRMASFVVEAPVALLQDRSKLLLRLRDVDGPKAEFAEAPR